MKKILFALVVSCLSILPAVVFSYTCPTCGNGRIESIAEDLDEICSDNIQEECDDHNRTSGDGCSSSCMTEGRYYQDADGDGYGDVTRSVYHDGQPAGYVTDSTDCHDSNSSLHSLLTVYVDLDNDNYGNSASPTTLCLVALEEDPDEPDDLAAVGGDCDDEDSDTKPGASEVCSDSTDNDCDGLINEGCPDPLPDADGDGVADETDNCPAVSNRNQANADGDSFGNVCDADYVDPDYTCPVCGNGSVESIAEDLEERCSDNIQEECDDGDSVSGDACSSSCTTEELYYRDSDSDGYGDASYSALHDGQPLGYVTDATDCDDDNADADPGQAEDCTDGIDNDCDFLTDIADGECLITEPPVDTDADGSPDAEDCDDDNAAIYVGAVEICDGVDNDCSGSIDDSATCVAVAVTDPIGSSTEIGDPATQPPSSTTETSTETGAGTDATTGTAASAGQSGGGCSLTPSAIQVPAMNILCLLGLLVLGLCRYKRSLYSPL